MRIARIAFDALASVLPLTLLVMAVASPSAAASSGFGARSTEATMPMGVSVAAPRGFLAFCERVPGECPSAPLAVKAPFLAGVAPFAASEDRFYRADAGLLAAAEPIGVSAAQLQPASAPASSGYRFGRSRGADWSGLFAAARIETVAPSPLPRRAVAAAPQVTVPAESWSVITSVNKAVNKAIIFRDDDRTWGARDYWALPLEQGVRSGDCEDYVLEKRHALLAEGIPKEALSIALVITPWGESHAVLLVATQNGEMVLDNLSPWIVSWSETGYRWLTRQAPGGDAMAWVSIASAGA